MRLISALRQSIQNFLDEMFFLNGLKGNSLNTKTILYLVFCNQQLQKQKEKTALVSIAVTKKTKKKKKFINESL